MTDDAELLRRYVDTHAQAAFSELVQRHFNVVYFAALRQVGGDAHRAQDVAQLVFTRLAQKAASLAHRPSLAGWLYVSTRLAALQVRRNERRRETREQQAHVMQTLAADTEAAIEWERLKPVIDDVLHDLKERDREVVLLRFFHAQSFPEIGHRLGITADAARFRIERALERMRAILSKRGVVSASTAVALTLQANAMPPAGLAATVAAAAFSEAAVTGPVAAGLGALKFMSAAKVSLSALIAVLGAAVCGEAVLAWSQSQELAQLRTAENALAVPPATASRAASAVQAPAAPAVAGSSAVAAAAGKIPAESTSASSRPEVSATPAPSAPSAPRTTPPAANVSEAFGLAMDDPAFRALLAVAQKSRLSIFYSPLFAALNLPPDRLDQFEELLVDKQQSVGDANRAAQRTGVKQDAAYAGIPGAQRDIDADIQNLLGAEGYARYQNYEATRGQRILVDQLQQSLSYTAAPLTDEQAGDLVQALFKNGTATNRPPSTAGLGAQVGAGIRQRDLSAPISEKAVRAAEKLLSPDQLNVLRQLQAQQQGQQVIEQKIRAYNAAAQPAQK